MRKVKASISLRLPDAPVLIHGLEARLLSFCELDPNAISFCEESDAIRVWIRTRENPVLVEDTGPGIPEGRWGNCLTGLF